MPTTLKTKKELTERQTELRGEITKLRDEALTKTPEGRSVVQFTPEQEERWSKVNGEYDAVAKELKEIEDFEKVESRMAELDGDESRSQPPRNSRRDTRDEPTDEDRSLAIQAWLAAPLGEMRSEHEEACKRLAFNPTRSILRIPLAHTEDLRGAQRAMRSTHESRITEVGLETLEKRADRRSRHESRALGGTGASGRFTAPTSFVNSLEIARLQFGGMLRIADVMRTPDGRDMPWPTANDTGNKGVRVGTGQSINPSGGADPAFNQRTFRAYKYSSRVIRVDAELLEDSAFDLASIVGAMAGERLGRVANEDLTTGTDAAMPQGIITGATLGVTATSSTVIDPDELIELVHSVNSAYRMGPGVGWMLSDLVLAHIRKLKDGEGRWIWQGGLAGGMPDTILNYRYTINDDMATTVATGNKVAVFGDLSKYKVREIRGVRLKRFDELYGENDQVGFSALMRLDGALLDAGVAPVKFLQMA
jgi:HK97 family phage major capsid protein